MDITYLKSFYTTVRCSSISKAAKELHLTQPGLSMQLQSLENDLGKKLLERSNKGVSLTPEGQIVFDYAKAVLAHEANMHKELETLAKQMKHITLGACRCLADYALPCSAYTFKQIYQNIDMSIESGSSNEILEKVKNRELNIGIVHTSDPIADMVQTPILQSHILLVTHTNIPSKALTLDEVSQLPLITRESGCTTNQQITRALEEKGASFEDLNITFQFSSDEAIKRALLNQNTYAFLPEMVIKHELHNQTLKKVLIKDFEIECNYVLLYRKDYQLKPQEQTFIDFITSSRRCFCY